MASLYRRPRSPYWWIKCRDTQSGSPTFGKTIQFSTKMRVGIGPETRQANQMCAERTLAEAKIAGVVPHEAWETWVGAYLRAFCKTDQTLSRYSTAWRNIAMFLRERDLQFPRQITRAHCVDFMNWRMQPDRKIGKYKVVHNTALYEIKVLSLILSEAVRRGYAPFNPCKDLGVKKHRPKEKPEFTDEHIDYILEMIEKEEDEGVRKFLRNSALISRYQGCRLSETHINPMTDVDIAEDGSKGLIRFRIKGGRDHTAPLHPKLIPMLQELRKNGATETYADRPNKGRCWWNFLKKIGMKQKLPGCCFHSFRVTAVTRLARNPNVSEGKAMKFIGHASTTIHRLYQRLRADDLGDCLDALG